MAVTTAAVAAAVTGVVVVQSGIPGTGTLPIVRHADAPAAPEGPRLPAPGETILAPPSAGVVQDVSAPATVVRTGTRSAGHPAATDHRSGKDERSRSERKAGKRDSGFKGEAKPAKEKPRKDAPAKDGAGKDDSGGKAKPAERKSKDH